MTKRSISETMPAFTIEENGSSGKAETQTFRKLKVTLAEIHEINGVLCTLLKNSTCAYINLGDRQKIFDLTMLTQNLLEFSEKLLQHFSAGATRRIIFEGKNMKILFLNAGRNQLSIFMRHEVDYCKILEKLTELT